MVIEYDKEYLNEFKIRVEGVETIATVCLVTDLTNHYQ